MSIDLGTGDGRAVLARSANEPDRLFVGIDAALDGLRDGSRRAVRGHLGSVLFVQAPVEILPPELGGIADEVTVTLPWGSLLAAILGSAPGVLAGIRALCRPGARIEVVFSIDPVRDEGELARLGLQANSGDRAPGDGWSTGELRGAYEGAGFF